MYGTVWSGFVPPGLGINRKQNCSLRFGIHRINCGSNTEIERFELFSLFETDQPIIKDKSNRKTKLVQV